MSWLNYREIPSAIGGLSKLSTDYITSFDNVKQFYNGNFKSDEDWKSTFERAGNKSHDRSTIMRILIEQNKDFHCSIKTLANIDLLQHDNTFAIVTGQQVGIFGGPLYTIYKILTALKLTEFLKKKYSEYNFVPIFWLESEDHDFDEMNHVTVLNQENVHVTYPYLPDGKPLEKNPGPVGSMVFDESINDLFNALTAGMIHTEFSEQLFQSLRHSYRIGSTFTQSFVSWINKLFLESIPSGEESGLIFINPNHKELKTLLKPIFLQEFDHQTEVSNKIIAISADLEKSYHAQVKPKAINLFMFHKGGRYLIEPRELEDDYNLKGTRHRMTKEELRAAIEQTPEMFSPNVVLRPICQDILLPTVAYVGGPGEIAYFAQLKPVYEMYDVPMPLIFPRTSLTILEERVEKVIEKYQLDIHDLFNEIDPIIQRISNQISEVKIDPLFQSTEKRLIDDLAELQFGLAQIDPTLIGALENTKKKIVEYLHQLQSRTSTAQQKKNEVALRQIQKAVDAVLPNGNLQERELNIIYFINKYGLEFMRWLNIEIKIDKFEHQILRL